MKSICPRCKEVVLSFGYEGTIRCNKCDTTFETKGDLDNESKD